MTNATIKRDLGALSSVMNFAIDQGWVEANPVLPRLQRLKERRDPITLPTPADVAKMVSRAPGQLSTMILAARATGCRQEELGRRHPLTARPGAEAAHGQGQAQQGPRNRP